MKKALKIIGVVLVVLVLAAVLVVGFKLGSMIKAGVETVGPKFTGGPVTLEKAFVRPFSGKGRLQGLVIGNPKGYETPSAFELGEVAVKLDVGSLTGDTILIENIYIEGPEITFEKSLKKSNIAQILESVSGGDSENAPAEAEEEKPEKAPAEEAEGKKVIINHVLLKGAKVKLSTGLLMGKAVTLSLPPIELNDIGKEQGGASFSEAISEILTAILDGVTEIVSDAGGGRHAGR